MDAGQKAVEEGGAYKMIKLEQIKEEKNTLSDKEIYLLQKLANKK